MNANRIERLAPLSGIVMVGLQVIGVVLTGATEYEPTAERALQIISEARGIALGGFYSAILLIWFAGSVFSALREREGGTGRLSMIAFGGGVVCSIAFALGYSVIFAAAGRARLPGGLSLEMAAFVYDLYIDLLAVVLSFGLATFIGATGIVSLRTKLFPTWFGWASMVFTVGLLSPVHYIFEELGLIWIAVLSILLYQRGTHVSIL